MLSFGLNNRLSFGLRFPTLRKYSRMDSLDIKRESQSVFQAETQAKNLSIESPPRVAGDSLRDADAHGQQL